jgi:hypothetical protein
MRPEPEEVPVPDDKSSVEKAIDLCVYAPVGAALYVRDMLPGMMGIFVSRGKRELGGKISAPPPPPPAPAEVKRRIDESVEVARVVAESGFGVAKDVAGAGIGVARDVAGSALKGLMDNRPGAPRAAAPTVDDVSDTMRAPDPEPESTRAPESTAPEPPRAPEPTPSAPPAGDLTVPGVEELPIPDYDELSASQVVERLDGLDAAALEAIRRYETAHRGRNTILGKIAQLG